MRLGLFDVSRRWLRQRTRGNYGTSFREQQNFSLSSVQFVDLILPLNSNAEIWTRLHAPVISSDIWPSGCVTSVVFGMACVIVIEWTVMQFTGHSLPVRQSMTVPRDFTSVPYCQPSSPTPMEYATSASLEWYVWSSLSGNKCHAVHRALSSGASLCDGTVRFLPCLISSAKLYFILCNNIVILTFP